MENYVMISTKETSVGFTEQEWDFIKKHIFEEGFDFFASLKEMASSDIIEEEEDDPGTVIEVDKYKDVFSKFKKLGIDVKKLDE